MVYPVSRSVIPQTIVRRERWPGGYRAKIVPLVHPGQEVLPDQPIMRIERDVIVDAMPAVPRLSLPSVDTNLELQAINGRHLGKQNADTPETAPAGMAGRVVSITPRGGIVIETQAALIQGAIG